MMTILSHRVKSAACKAAGVAEVSSIDPAKLGKWIQVILQFLPIFLAMFSQPTPPAPPPPVQATSSITTIDGLMEYVTQSMELHGLTEEQQAKVLGAVEALSAFLSM